MVALSNTCEGTANATVTTSNTGGANQFSTVGLGSGAVIFWATSPAHGSTCIKVSGTGTKTCAWGSALIGTVSNAYGRAYLRVDTQPTTATRVLRWIGSAATRTDVALLNTSAKLAIRNSAGTTVATSTTALTTGTWYRIEFDITNISGSTGDLVLRIYTSIDGTTAAETLTVTGASIGGTVDSFEFGSNSNSAVVSFDDIGYSSTGPVGPVASPITGTATSNLAALTQDADGTTVPPAFTGTAASTLAALTQAAAGTTAPPGATTGTAVSTLAPLTQAAAGTSTPPPITGTASSTLAPLTQDADGTTTTPGGVAGVAASTLPSLNQAAFGAGGTPDTPGSIPAGFSLWEYDRTGTTLIGQLVNARALKWRDVNSQPGVKSFEVPLADAGTLGEGSIVKYAWAGEIRDASVTKMEGCTLAVDGRVWLRFENQPGLLAMWGDAGVDPEYGLERNGGTQRHFGFMSQIGLWKVDANWDTPTGFSYKDGLTNPVRGATPTAFAASNPDWISSAGPDVNVSEDDINYFRFRYHTDERIALEFECSGDNFLTLYHDGEELKTPDPADPHAWYSADSIRVSPPPGEHIVAGSVANSYWNGGFETEDHRNNPIALILTAWLLNARGERASIYFKTNLTDWIVNDGDPEPGWHRAQVIKKSYLEAVDRSIAAETALGAPPNGVRLLPINFNDLVDTDGTPYPDRGQYTVDVASVPLPDIVTQLCEADLDIWVDPVAMQVNAYVRRGSDLSGTVELKVGADGGNLLDYTTTKVRARQTSITMRLAGDTWYRVQDDDAITESGLIETGIDVGSTSSRPTAARIGQTILDQSAIPTITVTAKTSLLEGPRPYLEFGVGDTVRMPGHRGVGTMKARCLAISVDASTDTPEVYAEFVEDRT